MQHVNPSPLPSDLRLRSFLELGFCSIGDNAVTPTRAKFINPRMVGMQLALPYFPCPNMLAGVDEIQNCCSVNFFCKPSTSPPSVPKRYLEVTCNSP